MNKKELIEKWEAYPFCETNLKEFESDLNSVIQSECNEAVKGERKRIMKNLNLLFVDEVESIKGA